MKIRPWSSVLVWAETATEKGLDWVFSGVVSPEGKLQEAYVQLKTIGHPLASLPPNYLHKDNTCLLKLT